MSLSPELEARIVADHRDLEGWRLAREGKIGASTAARFAKAESVNLYVRSILGDQFDGNQFATWGHEREPIILAEHGYEQNHFSFRHATQERFLATPDGIKGNRLAQVKTTVKLFKTIPLAYRRQVWWEQYVMGPEYTETDFIYELTERDMHGQLVPSFDSIKVTIARDEDQIESMVKIATEVLIGLDISKF